MKQLLVCLMALALQACAFSLTSSRGLARGVGAAPAALSPVCTAIDNEHSAATLSTGILGFVAGGSGITAIPVQDQGVRNGLMTGAGVSGVGAVVTGMWAQERAERYQHMCVEPAPVAPVAK